LHNKNAGKSSCDNKEDVLFADQGALIIDEDTLFTDEDALLAD
jgi:hypothetical protein